MKWPNCLFCLLFFCCCCFFLIGTTCKRETCWICHFQGRAEGALTTLPEVQRSSNPPTLPPVTTPPPPPPAQQRRQ